MHSRLQKLLAAAGCWLALSTLVPAQAGIIVGTYDPAFGHGFTGLGWMGEVRIDMPDDCLALSAASLDNAQCQSAHMVSGYVKLYDLTDKNKYELLDFMSPTLRLHLDDLIITDGTLAGIFTSLQHYDSAGGDWGGTFSENWARPQGTLGGPVDPGYAFYRYGLSIEGDMALLRASAINTNQQGDPVFGCPFDLDYAICDSETSPQVLFTALVEPPTDVPEPSDLLLLGSALAAAAWTRRRHARAH